MQKLIPVTLLTGFLGAGKTTVLNHLLTDVNAGRIAVIVNEFGDAGLDHDLIEATAEDVVLMAAGCICCSIRGDLSRTLLSLLSRRARGELEFDRVVIETTGLADPGPVYHTLLVDHAVAAAFALDGIVTVVDMALGADTLSRHAEAQAQVAMADRIILTKKDLASRGKDPFAAATAGSAEPRRETSGGRFRRGAGLGLVRCGCHAPEGSAGACA